MKPSKLLDDSLYASLGDQPQWPSPTKVHMLEGWFSMCQCWETVEPLRGKTYWKVIKSLGMLPPEGINTGLMELVLTRLSCYKVRLPKCMDPSASSQFPFDFSVTLWCSQEGPHQNPNRWGHVILDFQPQKLWAKQNSFLHKVPTASILLEQYKMN
jgi:hypothetical protein